jgi:4-hydroxybenzoate polyprenyltransferase
MRSHMPITARRTNSLRALITALRPSHWVKNVLVLAPILFSQNLFHGGAVVKGILAFGAFCLVSSSCYLLNDLRDLQQDRLHPFKRHRPLASGKLKTPMALFAAFAFLIPGLAGGFLLGRGFGIVLLSYLLISLAYTFALKHVVILDVFANASGFLLRAVAGAFLIGVEMSSWLLVCTTLLSLFLGFSKRRSELLLLKEGAGDHRQVLEEYNPRFLDMMIGIVTASTVTSYALYTVSEETIQKFGTRNLLLTFPFVLYGIFRYLYLVYHKDLGGDPIETALTDVAMIVNLLLWAIATVLVLYWR